MLSRRLQANFKPFFSFSVFGEAFEADEDPLPSSSNSSTDIFLKSLARELKSDIDRLRGSAIRVTLGR